MIPDVQNELNRKVSAAIQSLLQRNTVGLISDDQMFVALQGIWDSASGLIDSDLMDLLSNLLSNRDGIGSDEVVIYSNAKRLVAVTLRKMVDGTGEIEVRMIGKNGSNVTKFNSDAMASGVAKAMQKFSQICAQFDREGYRRLL
jgi:hypothetical protein